MLVLRLLVIVLATLSISLSVLHRTLLVARRLLHIEASRVGIECLGCLAAASSLQLLLLLSLLRKDVPRRLLLNLRLLLVMPVPILLVVALLKRLTKLLLFVRQWWHLLLRIDELRGPHLMIDPARADLLKRFPLPVALVPLHAPGVLPCGGAGVFSHPSRGLVHLLPLQHLAVSTRGNSPLCKARRPNLETGQVAGLVSRCMYPLPLSWLPLSWDT